MPSQGFEVGYGCWRRQVVGLGLSSRRNMCIHEQISQETDRTVVDAKCRSLTASWVGLFIGPIADGIIGGPIYRADR